MERDGQVNRDKFLAFVRRMKEVYPQNYFIPTVASANEWLRALADIPIGKLNTAFDEYVKKNDNPPSVAELRTIALGLVERHQFDPDEYWGEHNYWVLTDLEGYHINECITAKAITADEARLYFDKNYEREGTVLRPYEFGAYHPKYRLTEDNGRRGRATREDVERVFQGIDVEVER
jgi:hypothetical protein